VLPELKQMGPKLMKKKKSTEKTKYCNLGSQTLQFTEAKVIITRNQFYV
jgi:hypothetical protein